MADSTKTTAEHRPPERQRRGERRPALVCAFPVPIALPLPGDAPVGRRWLAEHGVEDEEISSRHFAIGDRDGVRSVEDVGSRNGVWCNGERLKPREPEPLDDGDVLRVGGTLLVYRAAFEGELRAAAPLGEMVGPFGLRTLARTLEAFGRSPPRNVLIEGESGTGKELAARAVAQAIVPGRPFVAVNVAGVPAGVFESQLFGHVAGAFSDARSAHRGIVLAHDGGAVFLDEIGELPIDLQAKILRLLENREVQPVGAERPVPADVLIVAATNRELTELVQEGRFRLDLFARLSLARLRLPPLRERREDIYALACELANKSGRPLDPASVEVEAVERLLLEPWPSNARGLQALLGEHALLEPGGSLRAWAVERILSAREPKSRPSASRLDAPELSPELVAEAIAAAAGNETEAARRLGVSRGKLRRFLAKR